MLKVIKHLTALTIYKLNVSRTKKIPTQFIITHYGDNTCGIVGESTVTSLKNIINLKTPTTVTRKTQQFPQISMRLIMAE
jgi:hypothetical protein